MVLKVYDLLGWEVQTLVDEKMQPGKYSVQWDGTNDRGETVASGVYLYRMVAGYFTAIRKMTLLNDCAGFNKAVGGDNPLPT